ncbi:MAG: ABC transporter ATP-binding protein [Firmicutes bacterium]|nr:ABC transporter ATP-binding protein [Bacillota bacterium]
MIEVRGLGHRYPGTSRPAVDDVSFEVREGEVFGFLGPSGAGKSTTQKLLTGLLPLQRGEVRVAGRDVRRAGADYFNLIGVSFESPNVYGRLTGLENLRFFASLYDVPTADPMHLLRLVGLEDAAHRRAGTYSKGMLHRLVFARSLLNRPRLWFLDEPTSGLDPVTSQRIREIIKEERSRGVTVFLTTHNMHVADELCDRVAFICDGRLVAVDAPRNLKLRYGHGLVRVEHREDSQLRHEVLSLTEEADRRRLQELVAGGRIETLHSQEATLEEVFIKVTGRALA